MQKGVSPDLVVILGSFIIALLSAYILLAFISPFHSMPTIQPVITGGVFGLNGTSTTPAAKVDAAGQQPSETVLGGLTYRWVLARDELDEPGSLASLKDMMVRAKAAGYNGIVFSNLWSDNSLESLDTASPEYLNSQAELLETAGQLGLDVYPMVLSVGSANVILSHDPDLAEGLPVKDALFVVRNNQATLVPDPGTGIRNGGFENVMDNRFAGWEAQASPGITTFADYHTKHGDTYSLRARGGDQPGLQQTVQVSPYRQYHLSMWVKTQGIQDPNNLSPQVYGLDEYREVAYAKLTAGGTQDWKRYDFTFNSLGNSRISIHLATPVAADSGTIWVDDVALEEIGLTNVIRRDAYPLTVRGEDGTVYQEGLDYMPVSDPEMGVNGIYSIYHAAPAIELANGSRIKNGDRLRVSFYHTGMVYNQVAVSLTDPGAEKLFRDQVTSVNYVFKPKGFFVNYDEIRTGNWETRQAPMTQGQVLASSFKRNYDMIRSVSPGSMIFVWNDMFDPYMNAVDHYYLARGTCDGSYNGLPGDVTVVNWDNFANRSASMEFFSGRGNPQILAGYYDGEGYPIGQWLAEARSKNINVTGVMYTTWENDYSGMDSFAREAWGNSTCG